MKFQRSFLSVALVAAFSATLLAQQAPSGYHSVACFKVKPEKSAEFHKFAAEDTHKYMQARADSGAIATWILFRSVIPSGTSAECDYVSVSVYPGAPPQPLDLEGLGAVLKKAGLTETAQEYVDRRASLTELVSNNMFQNLAFVGSQKKGDYAVVNFMKVPNVREWVAYENKVWKPLAEQLVKDGASSGWSLNVQVLPGGSEQKIQAVTVDMYPSWDAVFQRFNHLDETFKKVHPGTDLDTTFEIIAKLRTILSSNLFTVEDMVTPAK